MLFSARVINYCMEKLDFIVALTFVPVGWSIYAWWMLCVKVINCSTCSWYCNASPWVWLGSIGEGLETELGVKKQDHSAGTCLVWPCNQAIATADLLVPLGRAAKCCHGWAIGGRMADVAIMHVGQLVLTWSIVSDCSMAGVAMKRGSWWWCGWCSCNCTRSCAANAKVSSCAHLFSLWQYNWLLCSTVC